MAVSTITCPECKTVLKPSKPVPPGKAVKCPECGNRFTPSALTSEAPIKKPKKVNPAGSRAAEPKPKKASPKKPAAEPDEDEDGGTYAYMQEEAKADEDKPNIEYAPDMSTKDLRGPAASALVHPSNALIVVGALGFFGWLGVLVMILVPTLFPIDVDDGDKSKPPKPVIGLDHGLSAVNEDKDTVAEPKSDPNRKSFYRFFGFDIALVGMLVWYFFILALVPIFLGMTYSAFVTYGAVQIQNLEGYRWGITSCIMAMLPLNSFGFMVTTAVLAQFLLGMVTDDLPFLAMVMIFIMSVEALAALGVGVWVLMVLLSEKVVKGYEYKAD